jgi:hypothetical protein
MDTYTHCKEISIYVFLEKELRGLSPTFQIHVSVSDFYIHTTGPPIFLKQSMQTDGGNIHIAHRNMNVGLGTVFAQFLSSEYMFRIFYIVTLQCKYMLYAVGWLTLYRHSFHANELLF